MRQVWQGVGYGVAAGVLWGGVFLAPRLLPGFSPFELSVVRYLIYGFVSAILVIPSWRRLAPRLRRSDVITLVWLSLTGNILYYGLLVAAVQDAGMVSASLIVGLLPVTVTVCGTMAEGRGPGLRSLALPLSLIGAGVGCLNLDVPGPGPAATADSPRGLVGVACAFGALAAWTAYAVGNARYLRRHGRFSSHEWSLLTGLATGLLALIMVLPLLAAGRAAPTGTAPRDWGLCLGVMTGVGIGASLVGGGLWNAACRLLPPSLSGQLIVLETLFALLYCFLFERRWPLSLELLAIALLLTGVGLSLRRHAHSAGGKETAPAGRTSGVAQGGPEGAVVRPPG